ncbi:MAG TPA: pseudouridine-5'-phosphate glycosidase [Chloroflexota bacterium]|nr:pseudouridine-5'-phosphate glycosidase [Chloroflexota bacterium]
MTGSAWTPFVLGFIPEATGGRSVAANRALVLNNARVAAEVAARL